MRCPECKKELKCDFSIHTERNDRPIGIIYQWWSCAKCGEKFFGILEESKVNILSDSLEHAGYHADPETWKKTMKWARGCPDPRNPMCRCVVHQSIPPDEFSGKSAWYSCS